MNKQLEKAVENLSGSKNIKRLEKYSLLLNMFFEKKTGNDLERGDLGAGGNRKQDH